MSTRRVALYIGGASLLVAWLSSAASVPSQRQPPSEPGRLADAAEPIERLADDVRKEVRRLKERRVEAPRPAPPTRDPFAFRTAGPRAAGRDGYPVHLSEGDRPAELADPAEGPEPDLTLIGLAEHRRAGQSIRTALLASGPDELIMAEAGDTVIGRYTVTAVDERSVDLTDTRSGTTRRLTLP